MKEVWKEAALGYRVSSAGRVKSPRGRILRPQRNGRYGYLKVALGRGRQVYVHRLVAEAFIAPLGDSEVEHIDGDPSNNSVSNLLVVSHAENMKRQRLRKPLCGRGHAFAEHEKWASNGRRYCGECARLRESRRVRNRVAA